MPKKETLSSLLGGNELPYSPVVKIGNHFHFSGIVPKLNYEHKLVSPGDIAEQTKQVLEKIAALLKGCGCTPNDIYSATVMLSGSMQHFALANKLYSEFFAEAEVKPRIKAFAVAGLPFDAMIEIEFDAVKQE